MELARSELRRLANVGSFLEGEQRADIGLLDVRFRGKTIRVKTGSLGHSNGTNGRECVQVERGGEARGHDHERGSYGVWRVRAGS
jgi:hypothetical protein